MTAPLLLLGPGGDFSYGWPEEPKQEEMTMTTIRPLLTASGEVIYGETPEDGMLAKVYGDPELARVFAAAPELLAACKALVAADDISIDHDCERFAHGVNAAIELARAAIAEAEGTVP